MTYILSENVLYVILGHNCSEVDLVSGVDNFPKAYLFGKTEFFTQN